MRELNECTAEVFRRSEKRIRKRRRNRNRILALCVPLCLTVALWSVTHLPAMQSKSDKSMSSGENIEIANCSGSSNAVFVQVEIKSTGSAIRKDDADAVAQIYSALQSVFEVTEASDNQFVDYGLSVGQLPGGTAAMSPDYRIVFTTQSNSQVVYSLNGHTLTNESTGQVVNLSAKQRSDILLSWGEETE